MSNNNIHEEMNKLRELLKEDLIKYQNNIGKHMAKTIGKELTKYARNTIFEFYNGYKPKYYHRHYNFIDVPRYYYRKNGDIFTGGVDLIVDEIPDVYHGEYSKPEQVFNRVIFGGLRGAASLGIPKEIQTIPPIFRPSPYVRIKRKSEEIINDFSTYENIAVNLAKKDKYNYLFQ